MIGEMMNKDLESNRTNLDSIKRILQDSSVSVQDKIALRYEMLKDKPRFSDLQSEDSKQWIKQNLSLIGVPTSGMITISSNSNNTNIANTEVINTAKQDSINAKNNNKATQDSISITKDSNQNTNQDSITPAQSIQKDLLESCVEILEKMADMKVVWLHLQECTGCSESFLRTESPSFETLIFDLFKIVYHDLVMSPSGHGAIKSLEDVCAHEKYVLLVEGSVPMDYAQNYITLGNRNGYEEVSHLIKNAQIVFAVGTCSSFGGIQTAYPNPTNGHALTELFSREIVNIPGCPPSDKNVMATLMYYYLFECAPRLDSLKRPLWAYNKSVHDLCERKSFFMSGDFVESFTDENMAKGYCLYKVGCKGPYTYNNCPKVKFNAKTSWPVQGGHGCIGCSEPNFWDNFGNIEKPLSNESFFILNTAFLGRNDRIPHIREFKSTLSGSLWSRDFEDSRLISTGRACGGSKQIYNISNVKVIESSILDSKDYIEFARKFEISGSLMLNFSELSSLILKQMGENINVLSNFSFEINPKLVLKSYESKNKQGKKLYENYKRVLKNRYEILQNLEENSINSSNLLDIFCLFYVILCDDKIDSKLYFMESKLQDSEDSSVDYMESSLQDSKVDSKDSGADFIESNVKDSKDSNGAFIESKMRFNPAILQQFLHHANHFKFPYVSELSSKFKGADSINIDTNKSLSLAMAYTIGGLDSFGVCYSIMCDTFSALCETLKPILDSIKVSLESNLETKNALDSSNLDSKKITDSITLNSNNTTDSAILESKNNITDSITLESKNTADSIITKSKDSNKSPQKTAIILQGKIFHSKLLQSLIAKAFPTTQIFVLKTI